MISAKEVLAELGKYQSDRDPKYGLYKMSIAGQQVQLYDLSGNPVTVRAENILNYTEKGFTVENPNARATPPAPKEKK